jgi:hypothetical protein
VTHGKHAGSAATSQHVTIDGRSLTEDHGYVAGFSFDPTKRVNVDLSYERSIMNPTNTVTATLGVRLGHTSGAKPPITQ